MIKAITANNIPEQERPCMNPTSIIWPEYDDRKIVQKVMSGSWRKDEIIVILNKDWVKEI